MALHAVNKERLWRKLRAEGIIRDIESVEMYVCTGVNFLGSDEPDTKGITFPSPYQKPPKVYLNLSAIPNNDELAATIYHEVSHAYDPETPPLRDSMDLRREDLKNERSTWLKEIQYSIRTGGQDLAALLQSGTVTIDSDGQYQINEEEISEEALASGSYDLYLQTSRLQNFDLTNYVFAGAQRFAPFGDADEKHGYEEAYQREVSAARHGVLGPMSDDVASMYG